jgi:hypothetical protein
MWAYDSDYLQEARLNDQLTIARLTAENEALRAQLRSKDAMLQSLQMAILDIPSDDKKEVSNKQRVHVTRSDRFDVDLIEFAANGRLTKAVALKYGDRPLVLQTPCVLVPFGVSCWPPGAEHPRRSVQLCLAYDPDFGARMRKMDKRAMDEGGSTYMSFIKETSHGVTMRVNIPSDDAPDSVVAFDASRTRISVGECLLPGAIIVAIIRCNGMWHTQDKCGLSWTMVQVRHESRGLDSYSFKE